MILVNQPVLRLRLARQQARPVPAWLPATTLAMIAFSQVQVRFAPAGFSSVRDESHCWLRYGANKGPTVRT
jgi:integral membrane sensor domain MASE1